MSDLLAQRLRNQHLASPAFTDAADLVRWLGAVQAQDYPAATWGVGQRLKNATADAVERAFADGRIVRTHILRPTWHFVAPEDLKWMLALTAPRVRMAIGYNCRRLGLDEPLLKRTNTAIAGARGDGRFLTREEISAVLRRRKIAADGLRLIHILARAELDGVICSGPRRGKRFTYALLDTRVPRAPALSRDEALAELTRRYFISRGPATLRDFVWWSGLTMADAKRGAEIVAGDIVESERRGVRYWSAGGPRRLRLSSHLLPVFDEYLIAYADRSDALRPAAGKAEGKPIFYWPVLVDGVVAGSWTRKVTSDRAIVAITGWRRLSGVERRDLEAAAQRYASFLGKALALDWDRPRG
ncbi:MAG TPA: winged helix DNA-binding domain-containing protein [Vicinamibacterales bacterium]|nr:winged helix DNA-binding domain-containing protein [Vicinamibacterales bacterium]